MKYFTPELTLVGSAQGLVLGGGAFDAIDRANDPVEDPTQPLKTDLDEGEY